MQALMNTHKCVMACKSYASSTSAALVIFHLFPKSMDNGSAPYTSDISLECKNHHHC